MGAVSTLLLFCGCDVDGMYYQAKGEEEPDMERMKNSEFCANVYLSLQEEGEPLNYKYILCCDLLVDGGC